MATSLTTYDALLKRRYPRDKVLEIAWSRAPFLAMVEKDTDAGGSSIDVPVQDGSNPNHGADASVVFGATGLALGGSSTVRFNLTRKKYYALCNLDRETLLASEKDEGAFERHFDWEIRDTLNTVRREVSRALFRNGDGSQATIATGSGTTTTVNVGAGQAKNFEKGEFVGLFAGGDSSTVRGSPSYAEILDVDYNNDVLYFTNLGSSIASAAVADTIFKRGNAGGVITGLAGWLPTSNPTATTFFGVDRTSNYQRLSGVHKDYSSSGQNLQIEDAVIDLAVSVGTFGGMPDACFTSYSNWGELAKALQANKVYGEKGKKQIGNVGFDTLTISVPGGQIEVMADWACPDNRMYMLEMDTWRLYSLKDVPHIFEQEDGKLIRVSGADSYEVRAGCYAQLGCRAPGRNGVAIL